MVVQAKFNVSWTNKGDISCLPHNNTNYMEPSTNRNQSINQQL